MLLCSMHFQTLLFLSMPSRCQMPQCQILVWTVDVEPWEVLGVEPVPREAEEAFWRGYRAVKDQRTLDRVVAERELNLALSLLGNDDHPYARRARVLLDQIPES